MPRNDDDSALGSLIGLAIGLIGAAIVVSIIDEVTKKRKAICPSCKIELPFRVQNCPSCGILLRW